MLNIRKINLTFDDLLKLEHRRIGGGTDGAVYALDNNTLIKIYHRNLERIKDQLVTDDSDIKIYEKNTIKTRNSREAITYYQYATDEDIRLRSKFAIYKAINRQKQIERTNLPSGVVYLNGAFAGCILKRSHGIQIHKLQGLPMSVKRKIMLDILLSFKELVDHYIYPIDLANSPFSTSIYQTSDGFITNLGHSHVLVNPFTLKTNIIDVDGKSAIYMERFSEEYNRVAEYNLTILLIEFFLSIDTDEFDDDNDLLTSIFEHVGVPDKFIDNLTTLDLSFNEAFELVDSYKQLKKV